MNNPAIAPPWLPSFAVVYFHTQKSREIYEFIKCLEETAMKMQLLPWIIHFFSSFHKSSWTANLQSVCSFLTLRLTEIQYRCFSLSATWVFWCFPVVFDYRERSWCNYYLGYTWRRGRGKYQQGGQWKENVKLIYELQATCGKYRNSSYWFYIHIP